MREMKNAADLSPSSEGGRKRNRLPAVWRWLTEPSPAIVEVEGRLQARLLMNLLLVLLVLGVLSVVLTILDANARPGESRGVISVFLWTTVTGVLLLAVEYALSRTVNYPLAALLAVGTVLGATFLTVIVNPQDHRSLSFLVLGGLMGSLFLSARSTAIIFLVTLAGLLMLTAFVPAFSIISILNAVFFILTVGVLIVMATSLRQRYLDQIHIQTQQLVESEARLRELSIRDPLTGLFNRRYLEEMLSHEILSAARKQSPIGIIMIDIDHFKNINDTHGHAAGDMVLVQVGKFLSKHIRSSDVSCRYGGEEFLLILSGASQEITLMRAGQIREEIRQLPMYFEGQQLEGVTLSIGVAMYPAHGETRDVLLKIADAALYRAKRDGRDRVVLST
jgi:diguanylate cyclase (GGDEF)-like protein